MKVDEKGFAMKSMLQGTWIEQSSILRTPLPECLSILQMLRTVCVSHHINITRRTAPRHLDIFGKAAIEPLIACNESACSQLRAICSEAAKNFTTLFRMTKTLNIFRKRRNIRRTRGGYCWCIAYERRQHHRRVKCWYHGTVTPVLVFIFRAHSQPFRALIERPLLWVFPRRIVAHRDQHKGSRQRTWSPLRPHNTVYKYSCHPRSPAIAIPSEPARTPSRQLDSAIRVDVSYRRNLYCYTGWTNNKHERAGK